MAPRKDDDFMDVDSDSDISIPDDTEDFGVRKGKAKAKAGDKRKRDKGKGKAKDAVNSTSFFSRLPMLTQNPVNLSKHIHGKRRIRDPGTRCKRTRQVVCKVLSRNGWRVAGDGGTSPSLPPSFHVHICL